MTVARGSRALRMQGSIRTVVVPIPNGGRRIFKTEGVPRNQILESIFIAMVGVQIPH